MLWDPIRYSRPARRPTAPARWCSPTRAARPRAAPARPGCTAPRCAASRRCSPGATRSTRRRARTARPTSTGRPASPTRAARSTSPRCTCRSPGSSRCGWRTSASPPRARAGSSPRRASPRSTATCPSTPPAACCRRNPIGASGMIRFAEAALQVRGQAGEHQVDGARLALGHAYGGGSQFFAMWIVGARQTLTTRWTEGCAHGVQSRRSVREARGRHRGARGRGLRRRAPPDLRRARRARPTGSPTTCWRGASAPATTSASTCTTASSTSRPARRAQDPRRARSTSTTATSRPSCTTSRRRRHRGAGLRRGVRRAGGRGRAGRPRLRAPDRGGRRRRSSPGAVPYEEALRAGQPGARLRPAVRPTTSTSSTPAARPACPRA